MDNPNPIFYKDLIRPDDSITKLIGQLGDLESKYDAMRSKIQAAAADVAKGMQGVSGATEEQRKAIQLATEQSEKLVAEYRDVTSKQWEAKQAFLEASAAKREATKIDKLVMQINTSMEGSYNKLSAQYRLNKIRLDEMSLAEREGTEEGRALVAETAALYEEMKRLQEATGKHQLNVGNYADAARGLKTELMSLVQQMAYLKTQGEQGSEEYRKMAERAGELRDAMADAQQEVRGLASDTQALDATMGAAGAASGGMNAVTGTMALMGQSSETATDAQKNLGAAIGVVSGLTAVQSALQKESTLMTGIRTIQTKAATRAEQMDTAAKTRNIVATKAATVAQRLFNAVASANPYVLLALALVTVVGALVAFTVGANRAAKEQDRLNKAIAAELDYMERLAEAAARPHDERVKALQREMEVAKARGASLRETRELEDEIYAERVKAHDRQMEIYGEQVAGLEANRAKLDRLHKTLLELQQAQASGKSRIRVDVDLDGKVEKVKIDKAIEAVQGQIDNYGKSVQVAVDLKTEGDDLAKERAVQLEQRRREAQDAAKAERDILRSALDARLALVADSYKREAAILKENARRQVEDLRLRLRTEANLTLRARKALLAQMKAVEAQYQRDLQALRNAYAARDLAARRETEDVQIALMAEGADKQRELLRTGYQRQIEDLETALATREDLTETEVAQMYERLVLLGDQYRKDLMDLEKQIMSDRLGADAARLQLHLDAVKEGSQEEIDLTVELLKKQRDIELAQNAQLAEDLRQDEADIQKKWQAVILRQTAELTSKRALMLLDHQQELAASEMELLDLNERQKTEFQLEQERQRLQKILDLDKEAGFLMSAEQRKAMENTVSALGKQAKRIPYSNMYELLGLKLDSEQQGALDTAIGAVKDSISSLVDSWNQVAEAALNAANAQVDAAQQALDAEIEARNAGYANEVETAQKELALAKANQQKALKEKEKAQKAQLAIDTITQASSLVTASANIWSALGGIPVVGPGLAIAAIAAMWGSFALSKVKAAQATKQETYGEGTVELLQGGSHASGHDIDLGTKPDGTRRRAEGGEYFAVINRRNSRRFGKVIPEVVKALNDGSFAHKFVRTTILRGGSHAGGNDIERRAEGGECLAVISRRRSRRHEHIIQEVINSFNDGTFEDKYVRTSKRTRNSRRHERIIQEAINAFNDGTFEDKFVRASKRMGRSRSYERIIPDVINAFNDGAFADKYVRASERMGNFAVYVQGGGGTDVTALARDVSAIRKQGDSETYTDADGNTVMRYKNLTRKILN